jgi:ASC-1-like (ASCH) protein
MDLKLPTSDFDLIKTGIKTVELRAFSPDKDYLALLPGSTLKFLNQDTHETLVTKVVKVVFYPTTDALFAHEDYKVINPNLNSIQECIDKLFSIPTYKERIEQSGIFAIHLKSR